MFGPLDVGGRIAQVTPVTQLPADFTLLQITPALDTGGVEQTTLDMARAVTRAGGRALVASRGGRLETELARRGGELVRMDMATKNPLTMVRNARRLRDLIRDRRISLVHIRSRAPAFAALWAARATGVPVVTTYHGVYNARSSLKRWYNGVMVRGDFTIANSDFTRDHVLATHAVDPSRVRSIPRGVDLARFDPDAVSAERVRDLRAHWQIAPDDPRTVFLLAGRLTRWKGQELVIRALGAARLAGGPGMILVLAGDDQGRHDYTASLRALAELEGVGEAVRIVGHCSDMPAAYLAADFALSPSLEPEAFGRTAVEPQAMGRPVLAANHGGTAETVVDGETGWLLTPGSLLDWAGGLTTAALSSPEMRATMGAAGRARSRRFYGLEVMCDATLAVYAGVLAERAGMS
jgi:glycosyltransferase involved in cell wall biosynthesis